MMSSGQAGQQEGLKSRLTAKKTCTWTCTCWRNSASASRPTHPLLNGTKCLACLLFTQTLGTLRHSSSRKYIFSTRFDSSRAKILLGKTSVTPAKITICKKLGKKSPYIDSQFPLQMRFDLMVCLKQKVSLDLKLGSRRWISVFCFSTIGMGKLKKNRKGKHSERKVLKTGKMDCWGHTFSTDQLII